MKTNQLTTLEEGRKILRSVRSQRLWCMKHNKSYIESDWAKKELNNLENAINTIKTSDKMKKYLQEKQAVIHWLMPGKNLKNHKRLKELTDNN